MRLSSLLEWSYVAGSAGLLTGVLVACTRREARSKLCLDLPQPKPASSGLDLTDPRQLPPVCA